MKGPSRNASITLSIVLLVMVGCTRVAATKGHARAMKPAPTWVRPHPASSRNSDTTSVTPKVWELTALAPGKGPSAAS